MKRSYKNLQLDKTFQLLLSEKHSQTLPFYEALKAQTEHFSEKTCEQTKKVLEHKNDKYLTDLWPGADFLE